MNNMWQTITSPNSSLTVKPNVQVQNADCAELSQTEDLKPLFALSAEKLFVSYYSKFYYELNSPRSSPCETL